MTTIRFYAPLAAPDLPPGALHSSHLNLKEREWRYLRRPLSHYYLAEGLRGRFVADILAGHKRLGRRRLEIVERVAEWFVAGHCKKPTGRPPGGPKGAKDSHPRKPYERKNLPAAT